MRLRNYAPALLKPFNDELTRKFLFALLFVDAVLLAIFITYNVLGLNHGDGLIAEQFWRFDIGLDLSFSENFGFFKWTAIMVFMLASFLKKPNATSVFIFAVFAILLADDSKQLHEHAGRFLREGVFEQVIADPHAAQTIGELVYFAGQGVVVVALLWLAYRFGSPEQRLYVLRFSASIFGLIICGVGFDAIHSVFEGAPLSWLLGLIEDGGEIIFASIACGYGFSYLLAQFQSAEVSHA